MGVGAFFGTERAALDLADSGGNTVVAGVEGKRIVVHSLVLISNTAVDITIMSGSTELTGAMQFADPGGFVLPHNEDGWFSTAAGEDLIFSTNAATAAQGFINYTIQG